MEARDIKELLSLFSLRQDLIEEGKAYLRRLEEGLDPEEAVAILRQNANGLSIPEFPQMEKKAKEEIRRYASQFRRASGRRTAQ